MKARWMLLLLLAACGHLLGPDPVAQAPEEPEACTEETIGQPNASGCTCIGGGGEGAWGPHWARPIHVQDGGVEFLNGSERWCPRR